MDMINVDMNSCGVCKYSTMDDSNKAKVMVYCAIKEKWYIYGKCIPCDGPAKREYE